MYWHSASLQDSNKRNAKRTTKQPHTGLEAGAAHIAVDGDVAVDVRVQVQLRGVRDVLHASQVSVFLCEKGKSRSQLKREH
jgi:hypothetical protein